MANNQEVFFIFFYNNNFFLGISPNSVFISSASSTESCHQLTETNFSLTAASAPVLTQFDHSNNNNNVCISF